MSFFDRLRDWASNSDGEKVRLDRRAFLKGMAVTSAGLLVPGAVMFDMGRRILEPSRMIFEPSMSGLEMQLAGKIQIYGGATQFIVGDTIEISGTDADGDGKSYVVSAVTGSGLTVMEAG